VLSWVALSLSVVILGLAAVGYVLIQHYDGNIDRIANALGDRRNAPPAAPKNAQNILLVGSDSRAGENGKGTGGSELTAGQRSDTIILAHLYGKSDKALMVSFPRDAWVEIPAWTDPQSGVTHKSRHGRINSALPIGGPALLIATVEKLTGIRVDNYVQVDFVGFKSMVDKLGGVDVCLSKDVNDEKAALKLSAGRHHVNGSTALAFVRARKSFAAGDIDRIKHQQQLLGSMVHEVLSTGTLLNPLKLNGFLNVATSSLQVDETMSIGDMKDLALRFRSFRSGGVLFATAPIADQSARINGASVVLLDEAKGEDLFAALRRDEAPGTPATPKPTQALVVKPADVRVRVYNGSGVTGLARKAFNDLDAVGFTTSGTPTNRGTGATETIIFHGPSKADSARTLAAAIPGAQLREDPSLQRTLEVVVGSSYQGAQAVTVTGTPAPSTSTAAAPPVKVRTAQDDICAA
jgi:LCP family protein required for cell wall assembly